MPSYDNGAHGCLRYCLNEIPVGPGWSSRPQYRADCGGRRTRNCRTPRGERWQDGARRRCCHHRHRHLPPRGGSSRSRWWDRTGQIRPLLLKEAWACDHAFFNVALTNINKNKFNNLSCITERKNLIITLLFKTALRRKEWQWHTESTKKIYWNEVAQVA